MNRKGFTLIELLIVVVIIGILAAIAIPKCANTKAKAYIASMKSDLRNLVSVEAEDCIRSVKVTGVQACALPISAGAVNFCVTTGNNLGVIGLAAGNGGWGVTITNNKIGRAAGRGRVLISVVAVSLKKKKRGAAAV